MMTKKEASKNILFSQKEVYQIIELVHERPALWDYNEDGHASRPITTQLWDDITTELCEGDQSRITGKHCFYVH
jgi:hypothetical protein